MLVLYAVAGARLLRRCGHRCMHDVCFAEYQNVIFASRHARVRDPTIETLRDQHAVRFLALKQLYSNKDSVSREAINLRVNASSACVAFAILIAFFPRR